MLQLCVSVCTAEEGADSDLVLWVGVGDFECSHGARHGLHGGEDVLIDALGEALPVLLGEAAAVDDAHLADESGLPALPGACAPHTALMVTRNGGSSRTEGNLFFYLHFP